MNRLWLGFFFAFYLSIGFMGCDPSHDEESDELPPSKQAESAPYFYLLDTEQETVSLSGFQGQVVLLDFWATWCKPCQTEMPIFDRLYNQYQTEGLNVVGIALDRERMEVVNPFVKKFGIDYPILFANDRVFKDYDIMALPTAILIDREGRIRRRFEGAEGSKTVYEQEIKKWL